MGLAMLEIHKGCTIDTRHHGVYSSVFKSDKKIIFVKLQFSEVMTAAKLRQTQVKQAKVSIQLRSRRFKALKGMSGIIAATQGKRRLVKHH